MPDPPRPAPRGSAARIAATVGGNAFLLFGTLVLSLVALAIGWMPPRGHLVFRVARVWSRGLLAASAVNVEADFAAPLDPRGRYIFMANHRSLFDIPALLVTLPGQTRFLAKRSLFQIPLFGWALQLGGFITIDRHNLGSARDSFAAAVARLREGTSILVFPEGSRSLTREMLPFRRGGFLLALKSGLPIVPVGIAGSGEVQLRGQLKIDPGKIRIHYGRPLPPSDWSLSTKAELVDTVRAEIERLRETRPGVENG